jgi:hypothetical protein
MDGREVRVTEDLACLLRVEEAAAVLRIGVADLEAELERGALPTGPVDGSRTSTAMPSGGCSTLGLRTCPAT